MSGAILPLPQHAFMARCLVKHRDNFTFTFTLPHYMVYLSEDNYYKVIFRVSRKTLTCSIFCLSFIKTHTSEPSSFERTRSLNSESHIY
jgi:hypothetical protein